MVLLALILLGTYVTINIGKQVEKDSQVRFVIGMSQANLVEPWRIAMNEEIKEEAAKHSDVKVVFTDAAQSSQKQIEDIKKLMQEGIDLLILSPNDSVNLTPIVTDVYKTIPVIVLDRAIEGYDYTLYIGPDNKMIGRNAGQLVADLLGSKGGKVLEIQGLLGSPPVRDRSEGFREVINQHKNIEIVDTIYADWLRDKAEDTVIEVLKEHPEIDVIFAHNDPMAYGAYLVAQKLNLKGIKFVGIDGLIGPNGGLQMVKDGILNGTFTCSTGGKEAIRYAMDILNREIGIPKKIILRSTQITTENVDKYINEKNLFARGERLAKGKIIVGFSQLGSETEWRVANTESIISAAKEAGIELIYQNADGLQQRQIDSIRYFINQKVDAIVLAPVVETGWDEVLGEAKKAGIPVILSNRFVKTKDESLYVTWFGSDFVEQGRRAARWLVNYIQDNQRVINVVEIEGTSGSASSIGRKSGFAEVLKDHPNFKIMRSETTDYTKEMGKKTMKKLLSEYGKSIDVIFAYSDDMALGAIEAIEEYGLKPGKDITIVSVDGEKSAFKAMLDGKLNCTVENNPLFGPQIMKSVKELMAGKEPPMRINSSEGVFPAEVAKKEYSKRRY